MKSKATWVMASVLLIAGLLLSACTAAPIAPTTPATPSAPKVLKIGEIDSFASPVCLWAKNAVSLDMEMVNAAGGLDVGGQKYKLELVSDDMKFDQGLAKTAALKQIDQDGIKFIFGEQFNDVITPIAEQNKVLWVPSPPTELIWNPALKYTFNGTGDRTTFAVMLGWMAKNKPNLKTCIETLPDMEDGHAVGQWHAKIWQKLGITSNLEFYPLSATDLSALGTKIKSQNPDMLGCYGGGPPSDSLVMKAAYAAGYKGQMWNAACVPAGVMLGIAGPDAAEGLICPSWAYEFPDLNLWPVGNAFRAAYDKKYKWDDPEIVAGNHWWVIKNGITQSNSIDTTTVAAKIGSGMKFDSPLGPCVMVARPDYNNPRTVDCVIGKIPIKQIVGGKPKILETLEVQDVYNICASMYGW
jgi:branched-chain amino acid transport system substrate-binding protein